MPYIPYFLHVHVLPTAAVYLSSRHPPAADTFGMMVDGRVLLFPRLKQHAAAAESHTADLYLHGRAIVTGGLGDLGVLVAAWLRQHTGLHARAVTDLWLPACLMDPCPATWSSGWAAW